MANKIYEENDIQSIANAIRSKNGAQTVYTVSEMATAIENIPTGIAPIEVDRSDVNFYDYDGTILYSYTKSQFLALSSLPANPSHTGLTAQGWNWSLADAQSYVQTYGILDIGQNYITNDEKTRLYVEIPTDSIRKNINICFRQSVADGVQVNWGDGSSAETFSGSGTTNITATHTYSKVGDYTITFNPLNNATFSLGFGTSSYCIMGATSNVNKSYQNILVKVELGKNVNLTTSVFSGCSSLKTITIPKSITSLASSAFYGCLSLLNVILSNQLQTISGTTFQQCTTLKQLLLSNSISSVSSSMLATCSSLPNIVIPENWTKIPSSMFKLCSALSEIIIPKNISKIESYAFQYCYAIKKFDFIHHESIPTLDNANAFNGIAGDYQIVVPDSLYNGWKEATNWATYAENIVKASEVT